MKKMLVGNWKVNYSSSMLTKLAHINKHENVDIYIAAPFLYIPMVKQTLPPYYHISAQDCSEFDSGAYTGEISADMLSQFGVKQVIIGHSERRHKENNKVLEIKLQKALKANLDVVLCVGETLEQKNIAKEIIRKQMEIIKSSLCVNIAYEPIYAIGTGIVPKNDEIQDMLVFIKQNLDELNVKGKVLYGGSVTKDNIDDLCKMKSVDGFLVGGASLKDDFLNIITSCNKTQNQ